jgi:hypothetical protein
MTYNQLTRTIAINFDIQFIEYGNIYYNRKNDLLGKGTFGEVYKASWN